MTSFREFLAEFGDAYPPHMRYDGDDSAESLRAWQQQFRARLEALSGEPFGVTAREATAQPRHREVTVLASEDAGDHVREHVAIQSVLGTTVTAYVLVPKGSPADRRPGLLAFHGHTRHGKEALAGVVPSQPGRPPSDHGRAAVRAGFVVLCPGGHPVGPVPLPAIEQDKFDGMLDAYYKLRGWSKEGNPTKTTLKKLGIVEE